MSPFSTALALSRISSSRMARHRVQIPWLTFFSEPFSKVSLILRLHLEQTVITTPSKAISANRPLCNSLAEEAFVGPLHRSGAGRQLLDDGEIASNYSFIPADCGLEGRARILALRGEGSSEVT